MKALFFCLLIFAVVIFLPWVFFFSTQLNIKEKNLILMIKLFNHVTVYKNTFTLQGVKVYNEKKKEFKQFKKAGKSNGLLKAFTLTKGVAVIFLSIEEFSKSFQYTGYVNSALCLLNTVMSVNSKNVCMSCIPSQGGTVVIAEGIVCTTIANIIVKTIQNWGEKAWTRLKTKSKKS